MGFVAKIRCATLLLRVQGQGGAPHREQDTGLLGQRVCSTQPPKVPSTPESTNLISSLPESGRLPVAVCPQSVQRERQHET